MKKNKGVSLITLVITIIVVIILAAIALGGGALDTAGQAQFSGFASEMGALQETFAQALVDFRGRTQVNNQGASVAQLINYMARGETENYTTDEEGDKKWLMYTQARDLPCTIINREYATKYLGMKTRKVESDIGANQVVSYFVTPKGNLFCWPPYLYEEKSYVTNVTTVKTMEGQEIPGTEATNFALNPTVKITFDNGEEIIIANSAPEGNAITKGTDTIDKTKPSVWYNASTATSSQVEKYGVAQGYTFEGYDNTAE